MAVWGTPVAQEDDAERAVRAGARPRRGGAGELDAGPPGARRRADRRGRRRPSARGPGHGRRRSRQHRVADPVGGRAGHASSSARRQARDRGGDRLRGRRRARAQGQGGAGAALARAARHRRRAAARSSRRASSRRSSGATASCGSSRSSSTPPPTSARAHSSRSIGDRRHRQVAPRLGVREVHRRARRARALAPRPLPGLRRGRRVLGARRDGADARGDRRGRGPRLGGGEAPRDARPVRPRRGRARLRRAAAGAPARPRGPAPRRTARTSSPAWRLFFERLAEQSPVVMVFEDLQWADAVAARVHRAPAGVVAQPPDLRAHAGAARAAERHPAGARRGGTTPLSLDPLSDEAMERAPRRVRARACPPSSSERILARAEGVPLYAVETVRMLLDRGLLAQEGGVYRPTGRSTSSTSPRRCTRSSPPASTGSSPRSDGCSRTPPCSARRSPRRRSPRSAAPSRRRSSSRSSPPSCARRCSPSRPTRARPSAASTGSCRTSSARRLRDARRKRDRKAATSPRPPTSRPASGAEEQEIVEVVAVALPGGLRGHPTPTTRPRSGTRRASCSPRAGERAASLAAADGGAARTSSRRPQLADEPVERAACSSGRPSWRIRAARSTRRGGHFEAASSSLRRGRDARGRPRVRLAGEVESGEAGHSSEALERLESAFAVMSRRPGRRHRRAGGEARTLLSSPATSTGASEPNELALARAGAAAPGDADAALWRRARLAAAGRPEEELALMRHALRFALEHDLSERRGAPYGNVADVPLPARPVRRGARARSRKRLRSPAAWATVGRVFLLARAELRARR